MRRDLATRFPAFQSPRPHMLSVSGRPLTGESPAPTLAALSVSHGAFELADWVPACPSRSLSLRCASCTWIFTWLAPSCHSGVSSSVLSSEKPSLSTQPKIAFQSLAIASLFCLLPSSDSSLVISCPVTIVSLISCIMQAISYTAQS